MALKYSIRKNKYGRIHLPKVWEETFTVPATDTNVDADATLDLVFDVAKATDRKLVTAGVKSISGLPSGFYVSNISVDLTNKRVTVTIINKSGAAATVSANSISVTIVSIA